MGNFNNHSIKEIDSGDLVYFEDSPGKSNYDEYWEVISKNESTEEVQIHLNYLYEDHYRIIHLSEIKQRLPFRSLKRA